MMLLAVLPSSELACALPVPSMLPLPASVRFSTLSESM
jgi:hypothetical protein